MFNLKSPLRRRRHHGQQTDRASIYIIVCLRRFRWCKLQVRSTSSRAPTISRGIEHRANFCGKYDDANEAACIVEKHATSTTTTTTVVTLCRKLQATSTYTTLLSPASRPVLLYDDTVVVCTVSSPYCCCSVFLPMRTRTPLIYYKGTTYYWVLAVRYIDAPLWECMHEHKTTA